MDTCLTIAHMRDLLDALRDDKEVRNKDVIVQLCKELLEELGE